MLTYSSFTTILQMNNCLFPSFIEPFVSSPLPSPGQCHTTSIEITGSCQRHPFIHPIDSTAIVNRYIAVQQ